MERDARIFVAGHRGLVGAALCRALRSHGYDRVLTVGRSELDLRDAGAVDRWFRDARPEYVLMAAGTVGGIMANATRPAEFIADNLLMQTAVLHATHTWQVRKVLMLGTSCIYPRECPQPIREEYLLTGPLEPTNEPYAVAKIAAIVMARAYAARVEIDLVPFGAFRVGLLRHIGMEEKVLFAAAREARGGEPLPIAERLRVDHGAIAALLVPTPTGALVAEILSVLGPHNRREEEPDGVYDACDRALGPAATERLVEELRGFPEPPPKPYNDGPAVMSHIAANLELARRQWLEADTAS